MSELDKLAVNGNILDRLTALERAVQRMSRVDVRADSLVEISTDLGEMSSGTDSEGPELADSGWGANTNFPTLTVYTTARMAVNPAALMEFRVDMNTPYRVYYPNENGVRSYLQIAWYDAISGGSELSRDDLAFWQGVTFRRTLRLPGRPTKATFTIAPVFPFGVPTPFKTFKLALNGATVTQGKLTGTPYSGPSIVLGPKVLKRFTDGNNTVAVTVVRGPLPKKQKRCNTSSADLTGVVFRLFGDLDADLSLVDASVPTTKYYPAATQVHAVVNLSLTNKGPSGVIKGGIFKVRVGGISDLVNLSESTTQIPGTFPSAPPLDQCETTTVTPKPNLVVEIRCEMGAMPAGRVAHLSLGLEQTFASTEFHEATSTLQWTVSHPMDSSSDNQRGAQIVWCGTLSTKPECATG